MDDPQLPDTDISRRTALACLTAVVSTAVLGACDADPLAPVSQDPLAIGPVRAFAMYYPDSVYVVVARHDDPERFTLIVRQDGEDLETHEGLSISTLGRVQSEYFEVEFVEIPTA